MQKKIDWEVVKELEDITYKKCGGVPVSLLTGLRLRNALGPKLPVSVIRLFMMPKREHQYWCSPYFLGKSVYKGWGILFFVGGATKKARGHKGVVGEDGMPPL